ncbi:MAG: pentapeptide repeat-containing protein [Micavibrio sp.]|nr:pentapeptide repeat-containing protein [Micavibrio sp.]
MPALNQKELDKIISLHNDYMVGRRGGARAVIQYKDLSGLSFKRNDLSQADFTGCLLIESQLNDCKFVGASFFGCDLRNANLEDGDFTRADFRGTYVAGANLSGATMHEIDLREGKIMKRAKDGTIMDRMRSGGRGAKAVLTGAKMSMSDMTGARAVAADFSDADLTGVDLTNANLSGASFEGANLSHSDMTGSNLSQVNMRSSIISGTIMAHTEQQGLDMTAAITEEEMGVRFENLGRSLPTLLETHTLWVATFGQKGRQLDLSGYDLRDVADLKRFPLTAIHCVDANFLKQDLSAAELQSGIFDRSDFRDCKMIEADLRGASFKYAQLARADLTGAKMCPLEFERDDKRYMQRLDMSGANLRYASLSGADMRDAILMGVDLSYADLRNADLRRCDLTGALLKGAKLDGARLDNAAVDSSTL